jgi:uncharacterized glyoxalase superfamily protein PhnB
MLPRNRDRVASMTRYIRNGRGNVRPYVYGPLALEALVKDGLGGLEIERNDAPAFLHLEMAIGDSMLVLSMWKDKPFPNATQASIYVYVADVDATYEKALAAGATAVRAPADMPYGERTSTVTDAGGNTWFIAAYTGG